MKANPTPRVSNFMGMRTTAHVNDDQTWLEPEEMCYPSGAMLRRAYVWCPDGVKRVAVCGIPDTYFSIPARIKVAGVSICGYVTGKEDALGNLSLEFRLYDSSQERFAAATSRKKAA